MTIGGGASNVAGGRMAIVAGGEGNQANGYVSFAAGRRAYSQSDGCFTWGDSSNTDIVCDVANRWVTRATGGYYLYTKSDISAGVYVPAGGNAWSSWSDRALKDNFAPADGRAVLDRLAAIPITTWNYKSQDPAIRHIGPVAQDFYAAFGVGEDDKHIATIDADGVALAAIQGLYRVVQEKDVRIAGLEARLAAEAANADLVAGCHGWSSARRVRAARRVDRVGWAGRGRGHRRPPAGGRWAMRRASRRALRGTLARFLPLAALLLLAAGAAWAQTGGYDLSWWTVDGGGCDVRGWRLHARRHGRPAGRGPARRRGVHPRRRVPGRLFGELPELRPTCICRWY